MAGIFDNPALQFFKRPTMDDFLKMCQQRFKRFGLSDVDICDALNRLVTSSTYRCRI